MSNIDYLNEVINTLDMRIKKLEETLATMIVWDAHINGEAGTKQLLNILDNGIKGQGLGDEDT